MKRHRRQLLGASERQAPAEERAAPREERRVIQVEYFRAKAAECEEKAEAAKHTEAKRMFKEATRQWRYRRPIGLLPAFTFLRLKQHRLRHRRLPLNFQETRLTFPH